MARANPPVAAFRRGRRERWPFLHGPHTYISPSWYAHESGGPDAWNYAAVHAGGLPVVITDHDRIVKLLQENRGQIQSG